MPTETGEIVKCAFLVSIVAFSAVLTTSEVEAKEKVKIAFVGPMTGPISPHGIGGRNSAELAVKLMNADSKAKYEYELIVFDDECKPNVGVQAVTKAATDRSIVAAVPHYCSATAVATVDIFHRFKFPMIVWAATAPQIIYGNNYPEVHRVSSSLVAQTKAAADFLEQLGYKKVAIISDSTDFGKSIRENFVKHAQEDGLNVSANIVSPPDQQDFSAELTQIQSFNPDIVYVGGLTPFAARIRIQMDKMNISSQFSGAGGFMGQAFLDAVGPKLAEGSVSFLDIPPMEKSLEGQKFLSEYKAAGYAETPEAFGPFAFAAANLLMETIEKVGPDRGKITEALADVRERASIVGPINFDDHGQNITPLTTKYVVQDGRWVSWEDSEYMGGKRKLKNRP
jgi:branched-chain amino acid transport system substrate-binding protein